ncbi:hypothetical protein DSO57_1023062 [Entomophthora muscae]|uniref:Uncharacterized protein n=1 Tax=Entomophthora muscae TaxID=34485 RepID=A0ACC2RU21_9FUNG|nr:hypothetical protein DSO57_1023062 [Entomophthora muscae]
MDTCYRASTQPSSQELHPEKCCCFGSSRRVKYTILLQGFNEEYGYLPAYLDAVEPPPKINWPHFVDPADDVPYENLLGMIHVNLMSRVDSMVSAVGPESMFEWSMLYVIKLVWILWWAMPVTEIAG